MFRKFSRALGSSKDRTTVRFDVKIARLSDLPATTGSCRVIWARDSKVQMTKVAKISGDGGVEWSGEVLSIIASLDGEGDSFAAKDYDFKIQTKGTGKEDKGRFVTVGKTKVNLAQYVDSKTHRVSISVPVHDAQVLLEFRVLGVPVKGLANDDDVSLVSSRSDSLGQMSTRSSLGVTAVEEEEEEEKGSEVIPQSHNNHPEQEDVTEEAVRAKEGDAVEKTLEAVHVEHEEENEKAEEELHKSNEVVPAEEEEEAIVMAGDEELLERLRMAEYDAQEAKRMLEESMDLLEQETSARQEAEEAVESLEREVDWLEKKAIKERSDWEGRMRDSLGKMESTVLLMEKVQREKEDMERAHHALQAEVKRLEELSDASLVEDKIEKAEDRARRDAEEEASIEIDGLKRQIEDMAAKLETAIASQTVGAAMAIPESPSPRHESEDVSKALSLEIQYLKIENESLRQDAASATAAAERVEHASRREAEVYAQRAADYFEQLKESQSMCAEAERSAAEAKSRIVLLEDAVERNNLQAAELRQRIALMTMSGDSSETNITPDLEDVMRLMREAQDSAEARASQLALVTQELSATQVELSEVRQQLAASQNEIDDLARLAMTMENEAKELRQELHKRDEQRKEYQKFQEDAHDIFNSEKSTHSSTMLPKLTVDEEKYNEAHELAREAALMTASLTEQLAASNSEKTDLKSRLEETRFELQKIKSENDTELRRRVQTLEREIVVCQNRAEVNEIFRGEHDRVAEELIKAKIDLAEAQEQMIVLKRNLFHSQEKSMSFASKMTRLETKLYRRLSHVGTKSPRDKKPSNQERKKSATKN